MTKNNAWSGWGIGPGELTILDLGAAVTGDDLIYSPLLQFFPHVTGIDADPSSEGEFRRYFAGLATAEFHTALLGGGQEEKFFITQNRTSSSVFPPNTSTKDSYAGMSDAFTIKESVLRFSKKLEDIVHGEFDVIKSDIQGSDLRVLVDAENLLAENLILIVEMDFLPQFDGAPTAAEVLSSLNDIGFQFHMFLDYGTVPLSSFTGVKPSSKRGHRQWLWANGLFVKSPTAWHKLKPSKMLRLAAIMDAFWSFDYAYELALLYDHVSSTSFAPKYRAFIEGP